MEFNKILEAAKLPAAILIGIGILGSLLAIIPGVGLAIGGLLGLLSFFVLTPAILAWSGYQYAKKGKKDDYVGGAAVGALTGVIAAVVGGVISIVLVMLGFGAALSGGADG
ncbi:MAG: hypothetical protein V1822_02275, partial [Candidatus Micrarchaeota archaeon]